MSVTYVRFYCGNCQFDRTYRTGEEIPSRCPQCQTPSRPRYEWLRNKIPFLPGLVSLSLLFSLGLYDLLVVRAKESPWLPYVVGLTLFSLPWMIATLLLNWPRPTQGPHIVSRIKWSKQDTAPQELVGLRVVVMTEGHFPRRSFSSIIAGCIPILNDVEDDDWESERVYVLRPDSNPLEATRILFHPHWVRFKRGAAKKLRKECKSDFGYVPSMEELLLNKESPFREIYGFVYKTQDIKTLTAPKIPYSLLKVMSSGYAKVRPARNR